VSAAHSDQPTPWRNESFALSCAFLNDHSAFSPLRRHPRRAPIGRISAGMYDLTIAFVAAISAAASL